jgi:hypothetical protein
LQYSISEFPSVEVEAYKHRYFNFTLILYRKLLFKYTHTLSLSLSFSLSLSLFLAWLTNLLLLQIFSQTDNGKYRHPRHYEETNDDHPAVNDSQRYDRHGTSGTDGDPQYVGLQTRLILNAERITV